MPGPLTMSKLDLAAACPGAWGYPWATSTSEAARKGTILHAFMRDMATLGRDAALDRVPEDYRETVAAWDTTGLPTDPERYAHEVAFVLDPIEGTARELGRDLGRNYGDLPVGTVPGAADVVGLVDEDGTVTIDLKSGRGHVVPAARNLQLAGLAVAASLAYGRTEADVVLLHRREDGSGWTDRAHLDAFDLRDRLRQIRGIVNAVAKARAQERPDVHEGAHCVELHCPAFAACPAKGALLRGVLESTRDAEIATEQFREVLNEGSAAYAYRRLVDVGKLHGMLQAVLDDYASQHPIDLGDGRTYGPVTTTRESLDGRMVYEILRRDHGEPLAQEAIEIRATKAALQRVLGIAAELKHERRTHLERRVLEELRLTGGVRSKTTESVGIRRSKP